MPTLDVPLSNAPPPPDGRARYELVAAHIRDGGGEAAIVARVGLALADVRAAAELALASGLLTGAEYDAFARARGAADRAITRSNVFPLARPLGRARG